MDGTGNEQDTGKVEGGQAQAPSPELGTASASEKGTSGVDTGTLTQEQISDILAKHGRSEVSLTEREKKLTVEREELTVKQTAWQKQREEDEEEKFADDLPALTALRAERKKRVDEVAKVTELTDRETNLATRETEFAGIIERDKILQRTQLASEVAVDKGVSMDAILKGVALSKDESREGMEAVSELLQKTNELPTLITDNARTNKGGIDWRAFSPEEKIKHALANPKK